MTRRSSSSPGGSTRGRCHDADRLTSFYTRDALVESPMTGRVEGLNAIHRSFEQLLSAFPDIIIERGEVLVDGNEAAVGFRFTATHSGDSVGPSSRPASTSSSGA